MKSASFHDRRGSALLIVLGFLSFMVISAVAFSVYMRLERAPSSAMHRGVVARHLVKAALARAIGELDDAIRNDVFPGTRGNNVYFSDDNNNCPMDNWAGRIFMPPPSASDVANNKVREAKTSEGDSENMTRQMHYLCTLPEETVSVLNLEALGYLPPALVNDARFQSRRSRAAAWHYFPFGSGRFAYCAVNVSDYFDINRVAIGGARTSADPVSLAYLYTSDAQKVDKVNASLVEQMKTFVEEERGGSSGVSDLSASDRKKFPFVSMMDYNLALGSYAALASTYESPFYKWITQGSGNSDLFYEGNAANLGNADELVSKASRQTFVTDSWFASTNTAAASYGEDDPCDISDAQWQPFANAAYRDPTAVSLTTIAGVTTPFRTKYLDQFPIGAVACLYDYLDVDDVPTSLALPCTERTPMVVAVQLEDKPFGVVVENTHAVNTSPSATTETDDYYLKLVGRAVSAHIGCVFPFKYKKVTQNYKVQVAIKLYFAADANLTRVVATAQERAGKAVCLAPDAWNAQNWTLDATTKSVLTFVSSPKDIPSGQFSDIELEEDACLDNVDIAIPSINVGGNGQAEYLIAHREKVTPITPPGAPTTTYGFGAGFRPFMSANAVDPGTTSQSDGTVYRPVMSLWVRILNADGDTVDLVPAVFADDDQLNGRNNGSVTAFESVCGAQTPVMRLWAKVDGPLNSGTLLFNEADPNSIFGGAANTPQDRGEPSWEFPAMFCCDPRYNYAPEDWFLCNPSGGGNVLSELWKKGVDASGLLGSQQSANGTKVLRDFDIFMSTSDQGYLQSPWELAFVPRTSNLMADGQPREGDYRWGTLFVSGGIAGRTYATVAGNNPTPPSSLLNYKNMWRTYPTRAFYDDQDKPTAAESLKDDIANLQISTGDRFRINPYTTSGSILLGAFANPPCDWWTAGTNSAYATVGDYSSKLRTLKQTLVAGKASDWLKYCFGESNGSEAKLKGEDLWDAKKPNDTANTAKFVPFVMNQFQLGIQNGKTWEQVWDGLDWLDDEDADTPFKKLQSFRDSYQSVDKKFLYGFWRDSLAPSGVGQQLFLVFVRAESTALGGVGDGTGGALGGRAVALVWRDPGNHGWQDSHDGNQQATAQLRRPHRTRVLFYHQYE